MKMHACALVHRDGGRDATSHVDWLDGAFRAADFLMVHVLRRPKGSGIRGAYLNLSAYIASAEARPAYKRPFDAQLVVFTDDLPSG